MWDTVVESSTHLSHEMPCPRCGHEVHRYLPCSDLCSCAGTRMPGEVREAIAVA
jgi:hypothetical protein